MAKKRKTRQEKIIADLRRQLHTQETGLYSLPKIKQRLVTSNLKPKTATYEYVVSDLKKTVLFTIIALAAQIAIFFVLMR